MYLVPADSRFQTYRGCEMAAKKRRTKPEIRVYTLLTWADNHFARWGHWPNRNSGHVEDAPEENWSAIDQALTKGVRGFSGGDSLARFLARHRDVRNIHGLVQLSIHQILVWADAHHARTGSWPGVESGEIPEAPGEKWQGIQHALSHGGRGLLGGDSLARLLIRYRHARKNKHQPRLTEQLILRWADKHHRLTGRWPTVHCGAVAGVPHETWNGLHQALAHGNRGLPGGSSLAKLLSRDRGVLTRRARK